MSGEPRSLVAVVEEWLAQVGDCDLGPNCRCVGHDDLLIMEMEDALRMTKAANDRIGGDHQVTDQGAEARKGGGK